MPVRQLPPEPDLDQLRIQAKGLLRAAHAGNESAIADFREFHPERIDPLTAQLSDAQLVLARSYEAASWPQLIVACNIMNAVSADDYDTLRQLVAEHVGVAGRETRLPPAVIDNASFALHRTVGRLRASGANDFTTAMSRPGLRPLLDVMRLLGRVGAQPPDGALSGAIETLSSDNFAFLLEIGAEIKSPTGLPALALEISARNPAHKHRILETMVSKGVSLPDTPPMALHRGRLDLLEQHLQRDAGLLTRTFSHKEIWPPELGCHADESLALHGAPLAGATLLHMAVEYEELDIVRWLLDHGMNANVRASVDARGFGGHTPLFNCIITYNAGNRDPRVVRLLLDRGADPNVRASIRKKLAFARDRSEHEYRDVTPLGLAERFHDQSYVSRSDVQEIVKRIG